MTTKQTIMLAVAGATVLAASQAQAAYSGGVTFGNDDLLVSFRQVTGTGTTDPGFDLTLDLGNINTFLSTYEGQGLVSLNSYLAGTSLTTLFGAGLNNVLFSATAANVQVGTGDGSIYATTQRSGQPDVDLPGSTAYSINSAHNQGVPAGNMNAVGVNSFTLGTATGTYGAKLTEGSGTSYLDESSKSAQGSWGSTIIFPTPGTEVATGPGFSSTVQGDFYYLNDTLPLHTAAAYLGFFQLDSSGDLSYYSTPVPEPGTYGVLAGLGSLIFALRSRFRKGNA